MNGHLNVVFHNKKTKITNVKTFTLYKTGDLDIDVERNDFLIEEAENFTINKCIEIKFGIKNYLDGACDNDEINKYYKQLEIDLENFYHEMDDIFVSMVWSKPYENPYVGKTNFYIS